MFILTDIDHTISDAAWRDPMIGKVSWDEYHQAGEEDKPIQPVVDLLYSLSNSDHKIIAVTARPEKWRQLTLTWLVKHCAMVDEVLMRPDDCFLPSTEVKSKLIAERFSSMDEIALALEDRDDMVATYKLLGITVLQVHRP